MHTLDLNIENRRRIDAHSRILLHKRGKIDLVVRLDLHKSFKRGLIVLKRSEILEAFTVRAVCRAYALVKKRGKPRIRIAEPSSVGDSVCDVCKLIGESLVIIVEYGFRKDIGMKRRDAVHLMGCGDAEVCHAHLPLCYHGHSRYAVPISGIHIPEIGAEAAVYLLDYHMDTRKLEGKKTLVPAFERLGHDRMVCVRDHASHDRPRRLPCV